MKKDSITKILIIIISGFLLATPRARADATVIWTSDDGFDPHTVVIGPGEAVTWWNYDSDYLDTYVTFDNGFSFSLKNMHGVKVTFPATAGVYGYSDQIGDRGYVVVNAAPTVHITSPAKNAVFAAPATFAITATASDTSDDYVSDVEFFLGTGDSTNSIEDVYSEPFSTGLTNLDVGVYTLLAVARDSYGWMATNAITVTVTAAATVNVSSPRVSSGKFLFNVTGLTAGKTNIVQVSTNLATWSPVKTNIAATAAMTVTNPATAGRQFYRVLQLP